MTPDATLVALRQRRARDSAWQEFSAWCRGRRLRALPAHPWTVAAYLRWCEGRRRLRAIPSALDAIAERHSSRALARPDRSIVVRRTLVAVAESRQRPKRAALFRSEDFLGSAPAPSIERLPPASAKARGAGEPDESRRHKKKPGALRKTPRLVSRRKLDS